MRSIQKALWTAAGLVGLAALLAAAPAAADIVHLDDVIIDGSLCVGFDCVNGESFGFDTIRLKENNTRIHFLDTSNSASFPRNDWQLTANDSSNGGAEKFSIDDLSNSRTPFTLTAGAPSHSLFVNSSGRVGLKTNSPVVELHIKDGDTPTIRLEQDGSSGFQAQTWDLAGNETNFFIRDVTNGSRLSLRIRPSAPTSSIDVAGTGRVGMNTTAPNASLHVVGNASTVGTGNAVLKLERAGALALQFDDTAVGGTTFFQVAVDETSDTFVINKAGAPTPLFTLTGAGNLTLAGNCADAAGGGGCTADYVFEPDYQLMPLDQLAAFVAENKHLPNVPPADETRAKGLNLNYMNGRLLEKIEELVLYTLDQQQTLDTLVAENAGLRERLDRMEKSAQN